MLAVDLTRLLSARSPLQEQLPEFIRARRWFGGKARLIRAVDIVDAIPWDACCFLLIRVHYQSGPEETYSVPLMEAGDLAAIPQAAPHLRVPAGSHGPATVLYDAMSSASFLGSLLEAIRQQRSFRGQHGQVRAVRSPVLDTLVSPQGQLPPKLVRAEQSNSSVIYGDRLILKMFRRLQQGVNPDLEIGRFLTEHARFRHVPLLAGYLEYQHEASRASLAMLQSFVPNHGDAWEFTLAALQPYFERVLPGAAISPPLMPAQPLLEMAKHETPEQVERVVGGYLNWARLLGRRTAELHLALAGSRGDEAFDPEPFAPADQQALCQDVLEMLRGSFHLLRQQQPHLPPAMREEAQHALDFHPELERQLHSLEARPLTALRTRIHGDYHLGQVLVTGDDFIIIDFEGEPARSLAERRRKRSPLQDVAGMLRSFHYAAFAPLLGGAAAVSSLVPLEMALPWAYVWQRWVSATFLRSYLQTSEAAAYLPRDPAELAALLGVHLIEKAAYELGYELNNRPSWVRIPLSGIRHIAAEDIQSS